MNMKRDKVILVLACMLTAGLVFFGGHITGYSSAADDMHSRVTTAESTASNCLQKMSGWCDNRRFRLVDCGSDLQVCVCMSQVEVQGLRSTEEINK